MKSLRVHCRNGIYEIRADPARVESCLYCGLVDPLHPVQGHPWEQVKE